MRAVRHALAFSQTGPVPKELPTIIQSLLWRLVCPCDYHIQWGLVVDSMFFTTGCLFRPPSVFLVFVIPISVSVLSSLTLCVLESRRIIHRGTADFSSTNVALSQTPGVHTFISGASVGGAKFVRGCYHCREPTHTVVGPALRTALAQDSSFFRETS